MFIIKTPDINKSFILNYATAFSSLNKSEKKLIISKSEVVHYKKGDLIYKQGSPPDAFYCIVSGRVKIFRTKDNKQEELEFLTVGMYFGIISLLTADIHSVSAEAVNDSIILKIKKEDFDFILRRIPKLAIDLSITLSKQIRKRDLERFAQKNNIISVYSAARGIGRTMYAINLAISLKKETVKRVIFLEISRTGKEILKILGIPQTKELINLKYPLINKESINKFVIQSQNLNIDFLNIAHNYKDKNYIKQINSILAFLTSDYGYVIVDLPVEKDEAVFKMLTQSDAIHLITDYEKENLQATRDLMAELFKNVDYPQEKIKVILNTKKDSVKFPYDEVVKKLDHDIFANIPVFWEATDSINQSCAKVVLENPESEYARAIKRIAREIGDVLVGLALGSGAAFGLAHIGVIKVLEREKIPIDVVSGTSIGALIGALWASGKSGSQIEKIFMEYDKNKWKVFKLLFDFSFPKTSLAKGSGIVRFLKRNLNDNTFYDVKFPLKIVACDLDKRKSIILDHGSLVEAVRTSSAIPGIYLPANIDGDLTVDGGILEPLPIGALRQSGVKKIIAVNVLPSSQDIEDGYKNYKYQLEAEKAQVQKGRVLKKLAYRLKLSLRKIFTPNIFDIMVNSILAMEYVMAKVECRDADVVLTPFVPGANWFEFFRVEALIEKGEMEAERLLPKIKALVNK